jgi:hypothetical protein
MFKKEAMTFHNEVLQILLKIFTFNKTSLKFQAFFEVWNKVFWGWIMMGGGDRFFGELE